MQRFAKFAILTLFFVLSISTPIDLDLGWHLRYGQYFWSTGHVLKANILSYFWPHYRWVEASWGYDVMLYPVFRAFGFVGLSVLAAAIAIGIFLIIAKPWKKSVWTVLLLAAIFYSQGVSIYVAGFRAQTLSALMFALFLEVLATPKFYWIMPILFLLWANVHGGFLLGLIVGYIYLVMKRSKKLFVALLVSSVTPMIYPWGPRVYEEIFKHTTNTNLAYITEWQPLWAGRIETTVASLVMLSATAVPDLPLLVPLALTFALSLFAVRFLILFAVFATWYLARHLPPVKHWAVGALIVVAIVCDLLFTNKYFQKPYNRMFSYDWNDFCTLTTDCSETITRAMLKNPPSGHGFHPYNYGGYLTWRLPQVKTFLDGRMAAWEENGNRPPMKLVGAVNYQNGVVPYKTLDGQYHFTWAIVLTGSEVSQYLKDLPGWRREAADLNFTYYKKVQ